MFKFRKRVFAKDWAKEKFKDNPEELRKALWEINHKNYMKNREKIIAQHKEYRRLKKLQPLPPESV